MSEWAQTTLKELAQWSGGMTPSKARPDYWDHGTIPWISSKEVTTGVLVGTKHKVTRAAIEETSLRVLPAEAVVVVVRSGILARTLPVALVPFETAVNQDVKAGVANERTSGYFLRLLIENAAPRILGNHTKSGTTVESIDVPSLLSLRVLLPPLVEQRRIIAVMAAVDTQIEALEFERGALTRVYDNALSLLWLNSDGSEAPLRPLGDVMRLDLNRVKVHQDSEYCIAGVLNAGKGLISRGPMAGRATGYQILNRLTQGQVVMRKLTAWEGPIGVVPKAFNGFFASAEFPTFTLDNGLQGRYFDHVCRSPRLWGEMKNRVTGSVQRRKRLNPEQLLGVELPIPPYDVQVAVATALDHIRDITSRLAAELTALRTVRADLLTALLSQEITVDAAVDKCVKAA